MSDCKYFIDVKCIDFIGFEYPFCSHCEVIE